MTQVVLPGLGDGIAKATVSCWHAKAGDLVQKGDDIVELVTDKAAFNVSATVSGRLKKILSMEGDEVAIGQPLAEIE